MHTTAVMGILNITPDSFSDGGKFYLDNKINLDLVLKRALQMQADGAAVLDIGGESTRPGAAKISVQQELDRVIPVIEKIHAEIDITLSIDTSKVDVMQQALAAGASFINDVNALRGDNALQVSALSVAASSGATVCLMHMQGEPQTMQQQPVYQDVVAEVKQFLAERIAACTRAGIPQEKIWIDPGFGFGKTLEHNLLLIKQLASLNELGCPILVGVSRKSMVGKLIGEPAGAIDMSGRLTGSLALAWACVEQGAKMLRVHDVKETVDLLKIYQTLNVPFDSAQGTNPAAR